MSIDSTIQADSGGIHAVIDAFEAIMFLEDWPPQTPFAKVTFPETTSAAFTAVNITQFTPILDMEAFTVFNIWLLANKTINVSVSGNTRIRVSGISRKYPVNFKKTLNMTALGNFEGTTVTESSVELMPDAQGDNFFGTVSIPNPSSLSFELGNATFASYLLDQNVGTVHIDNMSLVPGVNNFSMRANVSQTGVLQVLSEKPYCQTGVLPFVLRGTNVTNHGQYLPYFATALASTNQTTDIDVGSSLSKMGLTIPCFDPTS